MYRINYTIFATYFFAVIALLLPLLERPLMGLSPLLTSQRVYFLSFIGFIAPIVFQINYRIKRAHVEMKEYTQGLFDIQCLGSREAAFSEISKNIMNASDVRNTYILSGPRSDYDVAYEKKIINTYRDWLNQDGAGRWEDIVGIQEFFSSRYIDLLSRKGSDRKNFVYVLREGGQVINFLILDFKEGRHRRSMVIFGWLPNDKASEGLIFSSRDSRLVALFTSHFEFMKRLSWNRLSADDPEGYQLDHRTRGREKLALDARLVDKSGTWISIAFGAESRANSIESIAIVRLSFSSEFVFVDGCVYDDSGNFINEFTSDSDSTFYLNNVYISYRTKLKEASGVTGICHYQFSRDRILGTIFRGVFADSYTQSRVSTLGFPFEFEYDKVRRHKLPDHLLAAAKDFQNIVTSELSTLHIEDLLSGPDVSSAYKRSWSRD